MSSKDKNKRHYLGYYLIVLCLLVFASNSYGQVEAMPLQFLKKQEMRHKDIKGEIYLERGWHFGSPPPIEFPIFRFDLRPAHKPYIIE